MCFLLLYLFLFVILPPCTAQTVDFHVGVILDMHSPVGRIGNSCLSTAHSDFYSHHKDYNTRLVLHPIDSNASLTDAAIAAFGLLRDGRVDAIIGPQTSSQANFVMDLGERAHVPIISFSATTPSFLHQTRYFVQTAQNDANQVQAIASIIKEYRWRQVVIIYEDSKFGNGIIPYLSNAIQDVKSRVSHKSVLPKSASDDFIREELRKMKKMETRVFVVHTSPSLGAKLFLKVRELEMMSEGYAWIVTSGLTDLFKLVGSDVVEAMQGVVGVRPVIPISKGVQSLSARCIRTSHEADQDIRATEPSMFGVWAYDTLWALAKAAEVVGNKTENGGSADSTKPFSLGVSETGPKLLKALLETRFTGLAGEFNLVNRQLMQTSYEIVNVIESIERPVGTWKQNRNVTSSNSTAVVSFRSTILWPGDTFIPPRGWEVKELRIGVPEKPGFNDFMQVHKDVFDKVMAALNLQYKYVPYKMLNGAKPAGSYDDLVYQVSLQTDYDGALGDITITANRSNYADFTMPYAEGGVACMVPIKFEDINDVLTFIEPLSRELWLTTALFYIATAVVIWIISKRILHRANEFPGQHAGMIGYIPFFPGEGVESNLVCLVLVTWAFVASLLNSTYTASLSSRLTVARLHPSVTNVTQLVKDGSYVGCQGGSFLVNYLKRLKFNESKIKEYESVDDIHSSLGDKSISAYCDVLPHIKHILSQSCGKYVIIDPIYRTDGFAFAFPKDFPAVSDISKTIIQLTEDGTIQNLEPRESECPGPDKSSPLTRVSLRSFVVLFAITGFVTLTCLVVSLLIRLHHHRSFPQRISHFAALTRATILALWKFFKRIPDFVTTSRILALWNCFKRNDPSSLSRTTTSIDQILQVEMGP
ncbi:hypothetical protein ACS0TY_002505 [Phlomoides rotata]